MTVDLQPSIGLKDSIERRHSVQAFRPDPIPEVILEEVLRLAICAPSTCNLQPWRFVILHTPEAKEKLNACTFDQPQINQAPIVLICCGDRNVTTSDYIESIIGQETGHPDPKFGEVETVQQIVAKLFEQHPSFETLETWTNRSTMLAVAYLMIVAQGFGVDSLLIENFVTRQVKASFAIPDTVDVCCLLCLGYAIEPLRKYSGRFSYQQVCFGESYGQPFEL